MKPREIIARALFGQSQIILTTPDEISDAILKALEEAGYAVLERDDFLPAQRHLASLYYRAEKLEAGEDWMKEFKEELGTARDLLSAMAPTRAMIEE